MLCTCNPDKPVREVIVLGTFITNQEPSLQLLYADNLSPVQDAQVTMKTDNLVTSLHWDGVKYSNEVTIISPAQNVDLSFTFADHSASAKIQVPPAIDLVNISNTNITINPNSTGSPALVLQWTALPIKNYSFLLQLEPLSENPVEIPFTVPAGRFATQYSGPLDQTGTILFDTDFKYYGEHRLTIYTIDKAFASLFFYDKTDLRGLALLSPDNIQNAKGFLTAVSSTSVHFTLQ